MGVHLRRCDDVRRARASGVDRRRCARVGRRSPSMRARRACISVNANIWASISVNTHTPPTRRRARHGDARRRPLDPARAIDAADARRDDRRRPRRGPGRGRRRGRRRDDAKGRTRIARDGDDRGDGKTARAVAPGRARGRGDRAREDGDDDGKRAGWDEGSARAGAGACGDGGGGRERRTGDVRGVPGRVRAADDDEVWARVLCAVFAGGATAQLAVSDVSEKGDKVVVRAGLSVSGAGRARGGGGISFRSRRVSCLDRECTLCVISKMDPSFVHALTPSVMRFSKAANCSLVESSRV